MPFYVDGSFKSIGEVQDFNGFKKREFVIQTDEKFPEMIKMEFHNDNVDVLDRFLIEEMVTIAFVIKGNEYQGKRYNNIIAIAIQEIIDGKVEKELNKQIKGNKRIQELLKKNKK